MVCDLHTPLCIFNARTESRRRLITVQRPMMIASKRSGPRSHDLQKLAFTHTDDVAELVYALGC